MKEADHLRISQFGYFVIFFIIILSLCTLTDYISPCSQHEHSDYAAKDNQKFVWHSIIKYSMLMAWYEDLSMVIKKLMGFLYMCSKKRTLSASKSENVCFCITQQKPNVGTAKRNRICMKIYVEQGLG